MPYHLTGTTGPQTFTLREGSTLTVGRAATSDLPLLDVTVSRRHAELAANGGGIRVRDLGSSNGTFVNGVRTEDADIHAGDIVTFGDVSFRVVTVPEEDTRPVGARAAPSRGSDGDDAEHTGSPAPASPPVAHRQLAAGDARLSTLIRAAIGGRLPAEVEADGPQRRLALLLEVARQLSRATGVAALLDRMADMLAQLLEADHVVVELANADGQMTPAAVRDRAGDGQGRTIPRSIARAVIEGGRPVRSDDAPADARFGGESVVARRVRSAMAAPLVGADDRVLGALYVDHCLTPGVFDDDDLDFLDAFSSIAAAAIEHGRLTERVNQGLLVRGNFERFFAPALAERIAGSAGRVTPGGEKRTVAVLFSDIRGFTALAERMRPDDVAQLLSEYLTAMVEVIFRHGGTLDKFIGDAIMAEWGAPVSSRNDADRALGAALAMLRELERLNAGWAAAGRPQLAIGLGLSVGEAFAGYIGSERRLEFTVIGDVVNLASRLSQIAPPGEILLTGAARDALREPAPPLREHPPLALRGKTLPVTVFSIAAGNRS